MELFKLIKIEAVRICQIIERTIKVHGEQYQREFNRTFLKSGWRSNFIVKFFFAGPFYIWFLYRQIADLLFYLVLRVLRKLKKFIFWLIPWSWEGLFIRCTQYYLIYIIWFEILRPILDRMIYVPSQLMVIVLAMDPDLVHYISLAVAISVGLHLYYYYRGWKTEQVMYARSQVPISIFFVVTLAVLFLFLSE